MSNNLLYYKYKYNTKIYIIQYIYKNMRKRLLIENDISELDDFQKILLLNKRKISPDEVEFFNSDGKSYDEMEVKYDGLYFTFDGLEEFLKFFFPGTYGDGSYDEYEASNLEQMYNSRWDFGFGDRAYDEWRDGYIFGYFCENNMNLLYDVVKLVSPKLMSCFVKNNSGKFILKSGDNESCYNSMVEVLDSLPNISDQIQWIWSDAMQEASEDDASNYIKDRYCDGLNGVGIKRYSDRYCFWKYNISWGNLAMMFINTGEFDGNLIDTMHTYIDKNFKDHTPESYAYEIADYVHNSEKFNDYFCDKITIRLEELIENLMEDFDTEYFEVLTKVIDMGGFGNFLPMKSYNDKYQIRLNSIDPDNLKIKYTIKLKNSWGEDKQGELPLKDLLNLINQPGLFDPMDYRSS